MVIDIACYIDIHKYTKQITLNLNIPASLFIASKHENAEKAHRGPQIKYCLMLKECF